MEPDNFGARTLAELPTHPAGYQRDVFKNICLNMIETGFHKWGFVVYRCAYGDDDLWARYLAQLKAFCHEDLVENKRAELLEQYLDWVVVEDRATLDNASRVDIRRHFNRWVAEQDPPKPDPDDFLQTMAVSQLPRFRYCLYVDKQCLDTVVRFQDSDSGNKLTRVLRPPMVFAVIDGPWTPDRTDGYAPQNEGGYPPIDGSDRKYVGWEYYNAFYVAMLYDRLHYDGLDSYMSYRRPPAICPNGRESMPS